MKSIKTRTKDSADSPPNASGSASRLARGALAALAALPLTAMTAMTARADDPPPPSRTDALVNLEFSDKYLTPRGMVVHDAGLTYQMLVLGFLNVYKGDGFLSDVTLVPGIWNDFSSSGVSVNAPFGSSPKTHWVEIDPIAGISIGFAKHLKLDVTYTAFDMQILNIGTSQHLDTKLSLDDSPWLKAFALHPYLEYWQELVAKATAADVPYLVDPLGKNLGPGPGSSFYFELGVDPGYTCEKSGFKLELPVRVLLPDKDFYGQYYAGATTIGLYEVGVKASLPLKFMPSGYGHWSFHAGFKYMGFVDKNLQGMQQFNAPGRSVSGSTQVYAGFTSFF